jgi:hypothetical protein
MCMPESKWPQISTSFEGEGIGARLMVIFTIYLARSYSGLIPCVIHRPERARANRGSRALKCLFVQMNRHTLNLIRPTQHLVLSYSLLEPTEESRIVQGPCRGRLPPDLLSCTAEMRCSNDPTSMSGGRRRQSANMEVQSVGGRKQNDRPIDCWRQMRADPAKRLLI